MEERKAYFDLISKKAVLLTEDEFIEEEQFRYISLGKWDKFLYDNEDIIIQDIELLSPEFNNIHYTIKSNTGAMSYNTYNTFTEAFTVAAVNLFLKERENETS